MGGASSTWAAPAVPILTDGRCIVLIGINAIGACTSILGMYFSALLSPQLFLPSLVDGLSTQNRRQMVYRCSNLASDVSVFIDQVIEIPNVRDPSQWEKYTTAFGLFNRRFQLMRSARVCVFLAEGGLPLPRALSYASLSRTSR